MSGTQLVRYDAMCRAIAEALEIDEVKEIRDKARAIEMYARQAQNRVAERQAAEIRLRAERKCGEKTDEMVTAPGTRTDLTSYHDDTKLASLTKAGISKVQASQWERLAAIPTEQFEADLADQAWHPTTAGLIERAEARARGPLPPMQVDNDALWLWGTLQEFERHGLLDLDPTEIRATMLAHMDETTLRLAPLVAEWLGRIVE
jgi:hypothetical protein